MADQNFARVESSLGDAVHLRSVLAREALGHPYVLTLELVSTKGDIAFKDVIGQTMTVKLKVEAGEREWNGIVTSFVQLAGQGRHVLYQATVRPTLWLLGHRTNCRIFQDKSVPDIATEILREHGITSIRNALTESYSPREYCVQYRESDLAFINRLFEEVGVYYFFEFAGGQHTMVLADSAMAHKDTAGYKEIPYRPVGGSGTDIETSITVWSTAESLEPGSVVLDDYDFVKPSSDLTVKRLSQHPLARPALEVYDYPGAYIVKGQGESLAKVALEALYAQQAVVHAEGPVRGLRLGSSFKLADHPRADQNDKHLVIESIHEVSSLEFETSGQETATVKCRIVATRLDRPYRPQRTTPRPFVHGPQTAVVVGKPGEEIWTDEHGRVKLKFHWDRNPKNDESVSCWVRVAQLWAGSGFGGLHVPRIGQEVVVEFLEGDPDRPLVTGRLYNGTNKSPFKLPDHADHSGVKSRSTKGGVADDANELRFEDTKGKERILFHAQKDMVVEVENDETDTIDHDRTTLVKNDEKVTVNGNRTEEVDKDEKITIKGNRTEEVDKNEKITIKGNRTEEVQGNETITIDGNQKVTVQQNQTWATKGKREVEITQSDSLKCLELKVDAQTTILLKTPGGSIELGPAGLKIKALQIEISADTQFKMKSGISANLEGTMVSIKGQAMTGVEGAMVNVNASGILSCAGAMVKIG